MRLISPFCALSILLLTIGTIFVIPKAEIAFFDKEGVQGQFIRQLAELKATKSQVAQSTKKFNEVLHKVLSDLAQKKKVIILRKNDVYAGGVDITDEVRIKLSKAMRNTL